MRSFVACSLLSERGSPGAAGDAFALVGCRPSPPSLSMRVIATMTYALGPRELAGNPPVSMRNRSLLRRLQARVIALILQPGQTSRAVIICIIGYTVLLVPILAILKFPQDLFMDSAEAYAWGQQFLGGYGRHPPLTGWIAGIWYRVFPAANWSSYALSHVMVGISLVSIYLIARRVLDARRAAFVVFILMLYPLFHLKSDRFNAYQVLLALMPLLVQVFLIAFEKRSAVWGALCSAWSRRRPP